MVENPLPRKEPELTKPPLLRCHSATEAQIKSALSHIDENPNMIGDCSKVC